MRRLAIASHATPGHEEVAGGHQILSGEKRSGLHPGVRSAHHGESRSHPHLKTAGQGDVTPYPAAARRRPRREDDQIEGTILSGPGQWRTKECEGCQVAEPLGFAQEGFIAPASSDDGRIVDIDRADPVKGMFDVGSAQPAAADLMQSCVRRADRVPPE